MEKLIQLFRNRQAYGFTFEETVNQVKERFSISDGFLAWKAAEVLNRKYIPDYRDLPKDLEGLRDALDDLLLDANVQECLEGLQSQGVLAELFPEVQAMVGFGDGKEQKNLWEHTKKVVAQSPRNISLRWAALFHDVGKVPTYAKVKGKITFHQHETASARLFAQAARRTGLFSKPFQKLVYNLIRDLGYIEAYSSEWTESAVRRVYRETTKDYGESGEMYFNDLLDLSKADVTTRYPHKREAHWERVESFRARAIELARKDAAPAPLPKGLGDVISESLGVPKSPTLGDIMKELQQAVKAGELPIQGPHEDYIAFIREHPERFQK